MLADRCRLSPDPEPGKTFAIVKRALYMIREKGIKPEQIMLAAFPEKAAKELITRISNELARQNIPVNINDMYIQEKAQRSSRK